jgi:hypothetical protein
MFRPSLPQPGNAVAFGRVRLVQAALQKLVFDDRNVS